ncbi:MAG: 3-deoxy-manno-octulosonate cytidylyltransferase [Proteobacteria bacterium]|nr:3-deoxy-manno-octulosonate cytidylyltransferase [Pseudomonadota bacterium]
MSIAISGQFVTEQKNSNAVPQETLILIPARMQATRLPGKPLADIHGKPMIVHVWRRATEAKAGRVVVATDSAEILKAVKAAGGEAVMTRADHASGSDRIHEALTAIDPGRKADIIVNLQGDLPTLDPLLVTECIAPLATGDTDIATLAAVISDEEERGNPNVVKVVGTPIGENRLRALYFTRATAPHGEGPFFHHIGIYAYRRDSLERFVSLPPGTLERREKLEQLRALEAQMRIDVAIVDTVPLGVDTPADLERARRLIAP